LSTTCNLSSQKSSSIKKWATVASDDLQFRIKNAAWNSSLCWAKRSQVLFFVKPEEW